MSLISARFGGRGWRLFLELLAKCAAISEASFEASKAVWAVRRL